MSNTIGNGVYIHPSATIGNNVTILSGSVIGENVEIGDGAWIGKGCNIFEDVEANAVINHGSNVGEPDFMQEDSSVINYTDYDTNATA